MVGPLFANVKERTRQIKTVLRQVFPEREDIMPEKNIGARSQGKSAKEKLQARKRVNLFVKRSITFRKGKHGARSPHRRSLSGFPKQEEPGWSTSA